MYIRFYGFCICWILQESRFRFYFTFVFHPKLRFIYISVIQPIARYLLLAKQNEIDQFFFQKFMCSVFTIIFRFLRKGEWSSSLPDKTRSRLKSFMRTSMRNTCHSLQKYRMDILYIFKESRWHRKLINYLRNKNYKVSNKQNIISSLACAMCDLHTYESTTYLSYVLRCLFIVFFFLHCLPNSRHIQHSAAILTNKQMIRTQMYITKKKNNRFYSNNNRCVRNAQVSMPSQDPKRSTV